jgi:hypothetical protein
VGVGVSLRAHDFISTKITWSREVSRIIYKRCTSCHQEGGSAFSLVNYEEARPWAKAIKEEVLGRRMPPWNAVKGFGDFRNDVGLTQEQISILADWVEGGAPEGEPAYMPPRPRRPKPAKPAENTGTPIKVTGALTLKRPAELAGIDPGKLDQGAAVQVIAIRPDGSVEPLIWIQNFNPTCDQPYYFAETVKLPAGSRIDVFPPTGLSVTLLPAIPRHARR